MCLIILKPAGTDVPLDIIQSAMDYNADGAGIMSAGKADKWTRIKPTKLARKLNALGDAAVHFRMATHGRVDHSNVHPFRAIDGTHVMHNGVLHQYSPINRKLAAQSDTALFVERYINPMIARGPLDYDAIAQHTVGNALAFMTPNGTIQPTGDSWVDYAGLKLSNTYAWDAPQELRAETWPTSYEIHDPNGAVRASDLPSNYTAPFDRRYPVTVDADNDDNAHRAYELEDYLLSEVCARVDEIDFADAFLVPYFDTLAHTRLLMGHTQPEDFIESLDARALLAVYASLERRK